MAAATPKMSTDITLDYPIKIAGIDTDRLSMRVPRLRDRMIVDRLTEKTDAEREVLLFANLLEVGPDELEEIAMTDYEKLQAAYKSFKGTRASKK